ncbi:alanine--tRNA ligase-related protein [Leptolyngbya sp. 7M]|uniref:alanine--tRNA ligase-related protein n=1 Tax=Leptolyngbya sp. 7M TaxID=2812896 RepID=UPI001B8C22A4|nr:alanyl-tRNA editing protein [Leptolyngbya sp. 7M]QYO67051.1 alanyl-tRNA editing protein [Leptolyngbya sp. 7M]
MVKLDNKVPLPPTEKLWIDDPYMTECDATILHAQDNMVITDRTIFYAESGGQVADQGWINDTRVVDVQKQPGKVIHLSHPKVMVPSVHIDTVVVHFLEETSTFSVGQKVQMRLDWPLRYIHMRYHSASHFLYHAVAQVYGDNGKSPYTEGCYIYSESARFDYGISLDSSLIPSVSQIANSLIAEGKEIIMEPDPTTREVSYWRYGDIIIPCGGTHVKSAAEIGPIRVKRKKVGKTTTRIYAYLEDLKN